jgi:RTX calcium-binding nonapeptide repeat (4 copies)
MGCGKYLIPASDRRRSAVKRAVILLTAIALAVVLGSGVALAKTIHCNGGNCFGTNRPDSIFGTNRHDAVFAKRGGDFVSGRGSADNLNGEDGDDRIFGGRGDDWIKGGRHADTVKGDLGNDRLTGGSGQNVIRAGDGMRDLIICGANSRNLIYFDPRLDHFRNCVFTHRSKASVTGSFSVSAEGASRDTKSEGSTP